MKVKLIAVGKHMPHWVNEAYKEYTKRLPPTIKLELIEIPLNKRHKNADIQRLIAQENQRMLAHIQPQDHLIALDVTANQWSTEQLAEKLKCWLRSGRNLCLLIGGPEGLSEGCLNKAHEKWSLSKLTLPHPLVRVILAEQLYRASSILSGHPYHR